MFTVFTVPDNSEGTVRVHNIFKNQNPIALRTFHNNTSFPVFLIERTGERLRESLPVCVACERSGNTCPRDGRGRHALGAQVGGVLFELAHP